jgi:hypothetical protein
MPAGDSLSNGDNNMAGAGKPGNKQLEQTHQMNVLGGDSDDLLQIHRPNSTKDDRKPSAKKSALSSKQKRARSNSNASSNSVTFASAPSDATTENINNKTSNHWWGNIIGRNGSNEEKEAAETHYQSLEPPESSSSASQGFFSSLHAAATTASSPTVEDQLRQDCSFFYQGLEDASTPRKMRTANSHSLNRPTRLLSSRDGAMFHAKYQRLNQEFILEDDLLLEERPVTKRSFEEDASQNLSDVHKSTLVYEQGGRILVKLPRDQVRLVVDHDMEAGIVSVEQWRHMDEGEIGKESVFDDSKPDLRYVLSVPDDLYRRVVSEMSDSLVPPYFGAFKCCSETEKADIRIALAVLCVVFFLMFISTLEWPTE